MPITREEALHLLDLDGQFAPDQVDSAVTQRRTQIEQRITSAPTDALKAKYRQQLDELDEAKSALIGGNQMPTGSPLSQTMLYDLPLANASYTRADGNQPSPNPGVLLQSGQTLGNGRYQIEKQIGSGGMGAVYQAFDKNRDKDIAIKVLLPSLVSHGKAKERFLQEARLSSEMSHPHIVTVFDVQQDGLHVFLTMELLKGQTLRQYLNTLKQLRKPLGVDEALKIIDHVCQGLAYAHDKGAVHRDIKPENIWLTETGQAKVMDFGIARLISTTQMTQTQMAIGTAYYMAPEQLQGLADIDGRADQYAVAIMLYEMLTGNVPTGRIESLHKLVKTVPKSLSLAVDKALSPRREERCRTLENFNALLTGKGRLPLSGNAKTLLLGIAGAAGLGLLIVSFPAWKGLLPDKDRENSVKQEVARLEGEIKSLQKRVDERRKEVTSNAQNAKRDVDRITAQIASARSDDDKAKLQLSLWEARGKQEQADYIAKGMEQALDSNVGLVANEGMLRAAEAAQKSKDLPQARQLLEQTQAAYLKLKEIPEQYQTEYETHRDQWLQPIAGSWSEGDCNGAATWVVRYPGISIVWPKHGTFEEKILDVSENGVITVVVSPDKYKGRLYLYQIGNDSLELSEVNSGRRGVMKRCN